MPVFSTPAMQGTASTGLAYRTLKVACRVVWAPDGRAVASASDDRSVMIWQLPKQAQGFSDSGAATMEPSSVLTGHHARLWDAIFAEGFVITASEDCTCRCVSS